MKKVLFLLCCATFAACNNQDPSTVTNENKSEAPAATASKLPESTRFEIIDGCVEGLRAAAGNNFDSLKTYALCNCMLREMQAKYPTADSTVLVNYLNDTIQVAQVLPRCQ